MLNLISKIPSFFSSFLCKYFDGFVVYGGKPGVFWNFNSFILNVRSKKMDDHDVYRSGELQFYSDYNGTFYILLESLYVLCLDPSWF